MSKMRQLSVFLDHSPPYATVGAIMQTFDARTIIFFRLTISVVLRERGKPEVGDPVVGFVTVDVVNLQLWPFPVNVCPSSAMELEQNSIHMKNLVAATA